MVLKICSEVFLILSQEAVLQELKGTVKDLPQSQFYLMILLSFVGLSFFWNVWNKCAFETDIAGAVAELQNNRLNSAIVSGSHMSEPK